MNRSAGAALSVIVGILFPPILLCVVWMMWKDKRAQRRGG